MVIEPVSYRGSRMNTNDLYAIGSHVQDSLQGHASFAVA